MTQYCIDDPLNAPYVVEAAHGPRPSPYFSKGPLDDVRGPQLYPHGGRSIIEGEEFFQISFGTPDCLIGKGSPFLGPPEPGLKCLPFVFGIVNLSGLSDTLLLVFLSQVIGNIT